MTQEESHQLMIKNVLENFDFKFCVRAMKFLNWKWFHGPRGYDFVTIDDLKETATYLITECIKGCLESKELKPYEPYFHATGGLCATTYKDRIGKIKNLKLEFILSEWECDAITGYDIYKSENKTKKSE